MINHTVKSQLFIILMIIYSISVVFYSQSSVSLIKLSFVTIFALVLPYAISLILSGIFSILNISTFIASFTLSLKYINTIIGILLLSVSTFRILIVNEFTEPTKEQNIQTNYPLKILLQDSSLQSKIKNWNDTLFCINVSPNKEILILPVFIRKKDHSLLTGIEIINCTEMALTLKSKYNRSFLLLNKKSMNNSWELLWDLSSHIIYDKRSWIINSNESWNLSGFKDYPSENSGEYRFSLIVNNKILHSNVFRANLELPENL